ncbi:MAG TPA: ABC transporter permease [Pedococcus sp.]|jgi:ABC-2 type transport system permease protein|nr:ABC transporter permease [Pedococcus sp.]
MSAADTLAAADPAAGPSTRRAPAWVPSTRLLRSELRLVAGRRRNQAGLAVLAAVPIVMAIAVKVSRPGAAGDGPDFFGSITSNGLFVPLAALGVEITMFLPLAMSMLSGDAIAGEANIGTLRYLLTVPVHRTRLLLVKYLSLCIGAVWGVAAVAVPGALIGVALFGTGQLTTLSGDQIPFGAAVWRVVLVMLYLSAGLAGLAAVGLFISTLTEQPIAAAIALMIFTIVSWIADSVPQLGWLHPWLVVHLWLSFGDLLRNPIEGANVTQGLLVDLGYAVVFWLLAWARFSEKDITS